MKVRARYASATLEIATRRPQSRPHRLDTPLVVSVASSPARYATLAWSLKSLLRQTVQPDATILWAEDRDRTQLPANVLALQTRGLTIRSGAGIRSYNKIIPALNAFPDSTIMTADDDVHYPANWLKGLAQVRETDSEAHVVCHRAHKVTLDTVRMPLPYRQWLWDIEGPDIGPLIFPTGVMGVLYRTRSLPSGRKPHRPVQGVKSGNRRHLALLDVPAGRTTDSKRSRRYQSWNGRDRSSPTCGATTYGATAMTAPLRRWCPVTDFLDAHGQCHNGNENRRDRINA